MFSKKPSIDMKKSTSKFLDVKRDIPTRFKHLKIVLDHFETSEAKELLDAHFSPVFQIFYEIFSITESTLKQKSHRVQREELDSVLSLLEKILILIPELLQLKWQKHALTRLFKRLLHPGNNPKLRKDAIKLFILWYQILGEQADNGIHAMFSSLVPGFPHMSWGSAYSGSHSIATPTDLLPLIPPQAGEKGPDDPARYYLDALLEFMVIQVTRIEWRDKHLRRPQRCFGFLFEKFQKFYLPYIFPDISNQTNLYHPNLDISELRRCGPQDTSHVSKQPFMSCRVIVLKWLANLTHVPQYSQQDMSLSYLSPSSVQQLGSPVMESSFYSQISEKDQLSMSYISEQHKNELAIVQQVLFGSRENVNLIIELFRHGFLLPLQFSSTIRKVLSLYKDWIHRKVDVPVFMKDHIESKEDQGVKSRHESHGNGGKDPTNVRAGTQNVLQIFITHAANVFLSWVPESAPVLLEEQVDICKRVLNIYRYMVMNTRMEQKTWEQLLLVLLQVTSQVLGEQVPDRKEDTLGSRLAPALFQTLIVTWIRANLYVAISVELWDQFVQILSSLTVWEELIREWAKTMDILTRVLAKNVYHLDLSDLPLDRLSEQKAKKRRAGRIDPPTALNLTQNISTNRPGQTSTPTSTPVASSSAHHPEIGPPPGLNSSGQEDNRSIGGSVRSRSSVAQISNNRQHRRHNSSGETSVKTTSSWGPPRNQVIRSRSEGNLGRNLRHANRVKGYHHVAVPTIPSVVEHRITRMLATETPSTAQLLRRPLVSRKQFSRKRSRSADSIRHIKYLGTSVQYSDSENGSRSPSPSHSSGMESNSIKDSPMQIDVMAQDPGSFEGADDDESQTRSVMLGGKAKGWFPDVAVIMWRRMLGSLGDPNEVRSPHIHAMIFEYLVELGSILIKIRQNQGVSADNTSTPPQPAYVPPLIILLPWCHKALTLPSTFQRSKLHALRLLCILTVRPHDLQLPRSHLLQLYRGLHHGLTGDDQEIINMLVKYCTARFFSLQLPGYSLLMLDFLHAANTIISSSELKGSPRTEAVSLVGSLIHFPDNLPHLPVLQPTPNEFTLVTCADMKDNVVALVMKSAKREATSVGRCVAISSLALFIYSQLTHGLHHAKIKEGIAVLLAVLKFKNRVIAQVACDMLLLLVDHADNLLQQYPDIPRAIIEDLSNTLLLLAFGLACNDQTKRLLLSLCFCLGEWCMKIPPEILLQPWPHSDSPPLLQTVFRVLKSVAAGANSPASHRNIVPDFDPPLDNIGENLSTLSPSQSPLGSPERDMTSENNQHKYGRIMISAGENADNVAAVKLAARMIMNHLINHIGHFPMGIGAARLSSVVVEHDDLPGFQGDELSAEIFQSPFVQFFVLNSDTLMSLVELPALEVPGGGVTSGLRTARSQVRVILRDLGGKSCWDASILYSLRDDVTLTRRQTYIPVHSGLTQKEELLLTSSFVGGTSQPSPPRLSLRHRTPHCLPKWEDTTEDMDNLDDLLLYIGATSPECIPTGRQADTLTSPPPPPPALPAELEDDALNALLHQKHIELDFIHKHSYDTWMRGQPAEEPLPDDPQSSFHHSRMLFSQLGLTSWDKRHQVHLLKKCDKLLRELKNLDGQKCRETHKIAVIYVGEGQEDKNSILSNSGGSQSFEDFVAALAWEVELETHTGFLGGLQRNRSTGETAPYYATSFTEIIFHVSTRMPSHNQDALLQKMRHLGNDEVHIVWSEHSRDYRRGIIPTEFCDVLIIIYPLPNKLFRIQISRKPDVPFIGPLFNECIVDERVLPGLVRATALNASRAIRSIIPYYLTFYEERHKALKNIIETLQEPTTFEDFCVQLCCPGLPLHATGSSSSISSTYFNTGSLDLPGNPSSGPSSSSGHVTFSSENSYAFPTSIFRHNSMQEGKTKGIENLVSADGEETYASPKASKKLSFKHATRKASAFGSADC